MIPTIVLGVRLWQIILRRRGSAVQRGAARRWRCHGTCKLALFASFDGKNMGKSLGKSTKSTMNGWKSLGKSSAGCQTWLGKFLKYMEVPSRINGRYIRFSSHVWWAAQINLRRVFRVHMAPASTKFWSVTLSSNSPNSQKCWAVREAFFLGFPSHTNYIDEPLQVIFDSQYDAGIIHLPISNGGPEHFFLIQIIGGL